MKLGRDEWKKESEGEFEAYLRGIETSLRHLPRRYPHPFEAYLRGIETRFSVLCWAGHNLFEAYLRGIETYLPPADGPAGGSLKPT